MDLTGVVSQIQPPKTEYVLGCVLVKVKGEKGIEFFDVIASEKAEYFPPKWHFDILLKCTSCRWKVRLFNPYNLFILKGKSMVFLEKRTLLSYFVAYTIMTVKCHFN